MLTDSLLRKAKPSGGGGGSHGTLTLNQDGSHTDTGSSFTVSWNGLYFTITPGGSISGALTLLGGGGGGGGSVYLGTCADDVLPSLAGDETTGNLAMTAVAYRVYAGAGGQGGAYCPDGGAGGNGNPTGGSASCNNTSGDCGPDTAGGAGGTSTIALASTPLVLIAVAQGGNGGDTDNDDNNEGMNSGVSATTGLTSGNIASQGASNRGIGGCSCSEGSNGGDGSVVIVY